MKCYYTQATSKWARIRKLAQFLAALVSHNLFSNPPKGKSNTIAYNTTTLCTFFLILAQLTLAYYSFVHDGFTLGMLVPNTQETAPIIHMRKKNPKSAFSPHGGAPGSCRSIFWKLKNYGLKNQPKTHFSQEHILKKSATFWNYFPSVCCWKWCLRDEHSIVSFRYWRGWAQRH